MSNIQLKALMIAILMLRDGYNIESAELTVEDIFEGLDIDE